MGTVDIPDSVSKFTREVLPMFRQNNWLKLGDVTEEEAYRDIYDRTSRLYTDVVKYARTKNEPVRMSTGKVFVEYTNVDGVGQINIGCDVRKLIAYEEFRDMYDDEFWSSF